MKRDKYNITKRAIELYGETTEVRVVPMTVKWIQRAKDEPPKIIGYPALFNTLSDDLGWFREKIKPGAFKKALKISDIRGLFNHEPSDIFARSGENLSVRERTKGLFMEADEIDDETFRKVLSKIQNRLITQMSFAFSIAKDIWESDPENKDREIRTVIEVKEVFDVSPVTFPAYPDTTVATRSKDAFNAANRADNNDAANRIEDENQEIDEHLMRINTGVEL